MASPVISFVTTTDTFNTWRLLTNNVINLATKGVYIDGSGTDPNANVVINGNITSNNVIFKQNNASLTFRNDSNIFKGSIRSNESANTLIISSPNANNFIEFSNTGVLTLTIGGTSSVITTNNFVSNAINSLANSTNVAITNIYSTLNTHVVDTNNPHNVTKSQVGLGNVDNTSDINKPISTATQNALNLKANLTSPNFDGVPTVPTAPLGTPNNTIASTQHVFNMLSVGIPAGAVLPFASTAVPTGWLMCNGALINRLDYPALFAAIGTTFGAGDGVTTFRLPDLRGEFIRGWDGGRGVDPARGIGTAQDSQNLAHTHGINDPGHRHTYTGGPGNNERHVFESFTHPAPNAGYTTYNSGFATTGITIQSSGGNESRPRNIALMYCIRAF